MRRAGGPPAALDWEEKLRLALASGRGVRLGEAAVVSRRLHVVEYHDPSRVVILTDVDFGQAAYGLADAGRVVHIDVFHSVAGVDHRVVAAAVRQALEGLPAPPGAGPGGLLMDYFDLGTATGGGRLTSGLDHMSNPSAMAAHQNHVHLAGLLADEDLALAWRVVSAVEGAITAMGVELRRIERLAHRRGGARAGDDPDLSRYYGDNLDSYINRNSRLLQASRRSSVAGASPGGSAAPQGVGAHGGPATLSGASTLRGAPTLPEDVTLRDATTLREGALLRNAGTSPDASALRESTPLRDAAMPADPATARQAASTQDAAMQRDASASRDPVTHEAADPHRGDEALREVLMRRGREAPRGPVTVQRAEMLREPTMPRNAATLRDAATFSDAGSLRRADSLRGVPGFHSSPALKRPVARGAAVDPEPAGPGAAVRSPYPEAHPLLEAPQMQEALALSRELGSPDELKRVLEDLARDQGWAALYQGGGNQAPFIMRHLEEAGLVRREVRGMRLTPEGKELLAFLRCHLRDVKLRFRKLIRRIPGRRLPARGVRRPGRGEPSPDVRYGQVRGTAPAQPGVWLNDVAVPETIAVAIRRTYLERLSARPGGVGAAGRGTTAAPGETGALGGGTSPVDSGTGTAGRAVGAGGTVRLRLERRDIHVHLRAAEHQLHICLLIDASASMAGRRILAAKHLARHLLVSTRDRIAVIAFQERDVRVYVPFTRDYGTVEEGLSRIQPLGLTPLAHGLTRSMELINSARVRRPLLLLITDGIPTVPKWTADPLADALEAARLLRAERVPFGCIGLQPSRRYLEHLCREAGGTLHVVDELSAESLISIAHQERLKLAPHTR